MHVPVGCGLHSWKSCAVVHAGVLPVRGLWVRRGRLQAAGGMTTWQLGGQQLVQACSYLGIHPLA
jgi:hypothetical protein